MLRAIYYRIISQKDKRESISSILAEEASDSSNQEQLPLVMIYVDSDCVVREEFLGFLHCDLGLSGKALAETVLGRLTNLSLDIRNCHGQCYDRAAAFLDILMDYLHIFVKLTVKRFIHTAIVTALI